MPSLGLRTAFASVLAPSIALALAIASVPAPAPALALALRAEPYDVGTVLQVLQRGSLQVRADDMGFAPAMKIVRRDSSQIQNALGPGQDPSPYSRIEADGQRHYYFPTIDFGKGVYMQYGTDLNTILSDPSNEVKVYTFNESIGTEAPDLGLWDDDTFIIYVSSVSPSGDGRLFVLTSDDPLGPYTFQGTVKDSEGKELHYYDAHLLRHPNGKRYLLFSGVTFVSIAELSNYTTIKHQPTVIISGHGQTVEAPSTQIIGDTLNLLWSENRFNQPPYNTRVRPISTSADPLDPSSWSGAPNTTILRSSDASNTYGPGSVGTFTGPDGQIWIAYGAFSNSSGFPESENPRTVRVQPVDIENDVLQPITPVKTTRYD